MKVNVRFFALYRERAARNEMSLELIEGSTVSAALDKIMECFPTLAPPMSHIVAAVNTAYVEYDRLLCDGDELVLIPPVSGGGD